MNNSRAQRRSDARTTIAMGSDSAGTPEDIFGSIPSQIFEAARDIIDAAVREGVSSLPFVPASGGGTAPGGADGQPIGGDEKLATILRREYRRNLDLVKKHAIRNLFAFPPSYDRRKKARVALAFLEGRVPNVAGGDDEAHEVKPRDVGGTRDSGDDSEIIEKGEADRIPRSKDHIPTQRQLQMLECETEQLQHRLYSARETHSALHAEIEHMRHSHRAACKVQQVLDDSTFSGADKVCEQVTSVVLGKEALESLKNRGGFLSKSLEKEKEGWEAEDDKKAVDITKFFKPAPKPPLFEDVYDNHRKMVETDTGGLASICELLKRKKRKVQA